MDKQYDTQKALMDCLGDIYQRLQNNEKDNRILKENDVLIFERLGIRERANGERKEQIQYAQDKISEIQKEGERCDANLFEKIDELQRYLVSLIVKIFLGISFGVIVIGIIILLINKII